MILPDIDIVIDIVRSASALMDLPGGDQLVLTTGCDVARTGEVFCDDPIDPDVLTDTPVEDALEWIKTK